MPESSCCESGLWNSRGLIGVPHSGRWPLAVRTRTMTWSFRDGICAPWKCSYCRIGMWENKTTPTKPSNVIFKHWDAHWMLFNIVSSNWMAERIYGKWAISWTICEQFKLYDSRKSVRFIDTFSAKCVEYLCKTTMTGTRPTYQIVMERQMWIKCACLYCLSCQSDILLQWRHNDCDGISNHRRSHCLLNCWFRCRSKKTSKLRVTGLCEGNSPVTGEFPAEKASNTEIISIWWRHHITTFCIYSNKIQ